jgi:CHASE3 domain sensor protein
MERIDHCRHTLFQFTRTLTFSFSGICSDHIIYFGAAFSFLVGCAAEIAWLLGSRRFLALGARYPMYMDTGLFCILAGIGLFAALRYRYRISRFVGISLALAANLHFAAGLAGLSVSVHNLFPHITAAVLSPSEMRCVQIAPATAVVFFLFGCCLALLSKTTGDQVLSAIAATGTVITSIGLIALVGYKAQLFALALQNSALARMDILTVLCTCVLGISLCAMLWKESRLTRHDLSSSAASLAVIGLILIFGGIDAAVFVNARTTTTVTADVKATEGRIRAVEGMLDALRKAEIGQRGFLLTNDEKLLATYVDGIDELKSCIARRPLRGIPLKDHDLQNLIVSRTAQLAITIQMQRHGQHRKAVAFVKTGLGVELTRQIESEAATITKALQADVVEQSAIREQSIQLVTRAVLVSYVIAVLLIALALYIVWTESERRNAVERKLRDNEFYLEERVEQRTQALHAEIALRTRTEESLRQSERLLDAALRFAGIAAWVWDCNEDRVCWTGNMQAVFGRESSELDTFIKLRSLIHPNDRSRIVQKIAASVATGVNYKDEFRVLLPLGEYRWISGIGGVVHDEHGQIVHMAGIHSAANSIWPDDPLSVTTPEAATAGG